MRFATTTRACVRAAGAAAALALCVTVTAPAATRAVARPLPTPVTAITSPASIESAANPAAKPVPLGDLAAVRSIAGAVWAPDGRSFVVATDLTGRFNLWRVDLDAGFPAQLTRSEDVQTPRAITPDGLVLYSQDRDGNEIDDLYAVPLAGGAVTNLTETPDFVETSLRVAPDGRTVALSRRPATGTSVDLVVLDLATRKVRVLTQEADPSAQWSPVGFAAGGGVLIANRGDIAGTRGAIWRIDLASGEREAITPDEPNVVRTAGGVSPDGTLVSVSSNEQAGQFGAGLMELATRRVRWLAPTPWEQRAHAFSPDGRTVVVRTAADGRHLLSLADVRTLAERPLPFPPGVTDVASPRPWSGDGRLLVISESGASPADVHVVDPGAGTSRRATRLAIASLDPATLPRTQVVAYRSFDGTPVSAILTMPWNLKRDGSNPAVVMPHGGPTWQIKDYFSADAVALASRGFVVIQPNFRGSTGYGRAFQLANVKDLGGGDLEDVVHAAKFLVDTGYVDAKRVGIAGGSYGGFMTLMALGRKPDVFAAGVNMYGIINWFTMWEQAGTGGLREYQRALVGDPVADREAYLRQSPMTYADRIRAPLLVLQGENDARVPKGQAEEVVKLVQSHGGTVEARYYAAEGHGFAKLENQEDARRRLVDWFERHLAATKPR